LSSILDALKKIEKESPQLHSNRPHRNMAEPKIVGQRRGVGFFSRFNMVVSVLVIAVIFTAGIIALTGLFNNDNTKNGIHIKSSEADKKIPIESSSARNEPGQKIILNNDHGISEKGKGLDESSVLHRNISSTKHRDNKLTEVAESHVSSSTILAKDPPEIQHIKNKTPRLTKALEGRDIALIQAVDKQGHFASRNEKSTIPFGKGIEDEVVLNQTRPSNIIDESILKLQAISWSQTPDKRIAVINSRIVKEGDSVDGCYIIRIDEDYVAVLYDKDEWQLKFSLK
jgi:hypothetical protein